MTIHIRPCEDRDLAAIMEIYNHAVAHTNAIWNDQLADIDHRRAWWQSRIQTGFPVLVATMDDMTIGYASFGPFRPHDGFRSSVEHSIYVSDACRGQGIGGRLLSALEAEAEAGGFHAMIGGIAHDNAISLALHAKHGFAEVGRMPEVATKFGQWQTLVLMQKILGQL